ncbi:hypothetical protein BC829DRAFT_68647 [Chytridium lagenaria]|nr:hypothetical protein BC829DRAFT_68647 [Chytridium lagenaria]
MGAVELIDGQSSIPGIPKDGTSPEAPVDGKKSESPNSVESGLKPPSLLTTTAQSNTRDTISLRGSRSGKLTKFSDDYLKGKKVYAVELAAAAGHSESVQALVTRMDPKVLANLSFALLVQRSIDMTILFLRCGVPWHQRDQKGATILHYGARWGDLALVVAIQQFGVSVDFNIKGENDWTPLHEAVSNRRFELANYLVRNGADSSIAVNGETPRELGLRIGISVADLDDCLSPLKAAPERELVIINEVKWTRFNTDQASGIKSSSSARGATQISRRLSVVMESHPALL